MPITLIDKPTVTLVAKPLFINPEHTPVNFIGESTDAEKLSELAGRICYQSQANKKGATSREYHHHILESQHGSVYEHPCFSFYLEGVSRALSLELIRHGDGTAISQLSQRFVDESRGYFVVPPAILNAPEPAKTALLYAFERTCERAHEDYLLLVSMLTDLYKDIPDATLRRKKVREAARHALNEATETKLVFSMNVRALRWILTLRGSEHADAEIRRLSLAIYDVAKVELPNLLQDFEVTPVYGEDTLTCQFHKV